MSSPVTSRRAFVASGVAYGVAALALALTPARVMHAGAVHAGPRGCGHRGHAGARRGGPHPTPRANVTAARVVPAAKLADESSAVRAAFEDARRIPGVIDGIRCQCGCADYDETTYSLLSCFEGEGMARDCLICQGSARLAFRMHNAGKSLAEIRAAVDERYGE